MIVYWLHNQSHTNPLVEGYIGITNNITSRTKQHRTGHRTGRGGCRHDFEVVTILFRGVEKKCVALEYEMRPRCSIGWNVNPGGGGRWRKVQAGRPAPKTPKKRTIQKLRRLLVKENSPKPAPTPKVRRHNRLFVEDVLSKLPTQLNLIKQTRKAINDVGRFLSAPKATNEDIVHDVVKNYRSVYLGNLRDPKHEDAFVSWLADNPVAYLEGVS